MAQKPAIHFIATGGTIAGSGASATHASYEPGRLDIGSLLAAVDGLDAITDISGNSETLFATGSENLGPENWRRLAGRIHEITASGAVDGIVVTHGTDTLEEAAFFLELVCRTNLPVALTAAIRPATALSADGPANIFQAALACVGPSLRGQRIMVVLNGQVHSGWAAIKANSVALEAFRAHPGGAAARIVGEQILAVAPPNPCPMAGEFSGVLDGADDLPHVQLASLHAGCGAEPLTNWDSARCKGLVVAGFGAGCVPDEADQKIRDMAATGFPVVISSRVSEAIVTPHTMQPRDVAGVVAAGVLNPQKSVVLLQLLLAAKHDRKAIAETFGRFGGGSV